LELARQQATFRIPPPAKPERAAGPRAMTALAIAIALAAAGALVIGLAWSAAAMAPIPGAGTPPESLPYALGWSGASLAALAGSLASLFCGDGRRRRGLVSTAAAAALGLLAFAVVASA
jgi:hypothetical protein